MIVAAFDLAQNVGYAVGSPDGIQASGVKSFVPKRGDSLGLRWILFREWFGGFCEHYRPEVVVFEQAFIGAMRSKPVAEWALGLRTLVQEECDRRGIAYREVHNTQIKLHATGRGNADKLAMQAAAVVKWPDYRPENDKGCDEADARHLLAYALDGFPQLETQAEQQKRKRREAKALKAR